MASSMYRKFPTFLRQGIEKVPRGTVTTSWVPMRKQNYSSLTEKEKNQRLLSEVNIEVKGSDEAVLASYWQFIKKAAECLDINTNRVALPTNVEKYTLLKSPHIYKKHRVQYEIRTHRLLLQFKELTGDTADTFVEYIQRNCPEGVSMDVQQTELEELFLNMPPEATQFLETQNDMKPAKT